MFNLDFSSMLFEVDPIYLHYMTADRQKRFDQISKLNCCKRCFPTGFIVGFVQVKSMEFQISVLTISSETIFKPGLKKTYIYQPIDCTDKKFS